MEISDIKQKLSVLAASFLFWEAGYVGKILGMR